MQAIKCLFTYGFCRSWMPGLVKTCSLLLVASALLSACSNNDGTLHTGADGQSSLSLQPPSFLTTRAIVSENLRLEVTINGFNVNMTRNGASSWTGTTTIAQGSSVELVVQWAETIGARTLPLAQARSSLATINANTTFTVLESGYDTSAVNFDADGDSISNIEERRAGSDPFDASSPDAGMGDPPLVRVPAVASTLVPVIDGMFDMDGRWSRAEAQDANQNLLLIDNLLVDSANNQIDGATGYQWAALHDEVRLYIYVFAKIGPSFADSAEAFNNDSLEIFWDGNFSRGNAYDGVDDVQLIIPLVNPNRNGGFANNSVDADSAVQLGVNSESGFALSGNAPFDLSTLEFATCTCTGTQIYWEVSIDLAAAKIPLGQTFGFEIQINEDLDGGNRDVKWAWARPSKTEDEPGTQADDTFRFPSRMAPIRLTPFPDTGS